MRHRLISTILLLLMSGSAFATSADKIDRRSDEAIADFQKEINGAEVFLAQAAGYLIFPRVVKAGIGVGGEYGEGALRVDGKTVDYYSTAAGSFGLQLGAQAKSIIVIFMTQESLKKFRDSDGWKVGIDGSVALIDVGAGKSIDSNNVRDPVVGFVFGSKGLMYNLTLEGSKFTKLDKR
ncbi:MAG: YSC84-related protein [Pseudomonadota bacterium]